jgi:DNA mismatch endonuclease (patch repair protein)
MSRDKRNSMMAKIRKTNTKPELIVRKFLFKNGFRYRLYNKKLPGNPDIVLKKYQTIIFVNGCFWHMHEGCKYNRIPKSRPDYWPHKLQGNVNRDKMNKIELEKLGWNVLIIWECDLKKDKINTTLANIIEQVINHTNN